MTQFRLIFDDEPAGLFPEPPAQPKRRKRASSVAPSAARPVLTPAQAPSLIPADTAEAAPVPAPAVSPASTPVETPAKTPAKTPAASVSVAPPPAALKPEAAPTPEAPSTEALTPEAMAQALEQHPDFRVLRRLVPASDYGPPPADTTQVQRLLVLDTETTGLSHRADKIIELALLLVQVDAATGLPFGPVEIYEGFEDPGMPIPEVAKAVTGITDDMVRGQRLDDSKVQALVQRADLVVAHNAGFDRPFMEARFPALADKAWACSFKDIDWTAAGAGSAKLSALAQDHGWFYDAHRAQVDCHALLQVLARPVPPVTEAGPETGLARLLAAAARPSFQLSATGAPFEAKDKLKARGYRWDGEARVWGCSLASPELLYAECAWLRQEVYGRRAARLDVAGLDSRVRYSLRPGEVSVREL